VISLLMPEARTPTRTLGARLRAHYPALIVTAVFVVVYCLISLVNHSLYRSYALDLGLYTNAAWKYGHFMLPDRSLFLVNRDLLLADHFDLHLVLWSPLTYLFGQWTLLVVQIAAVALGGLGLYRFMMEVHPDRPLATVMMCCGFAFFGIYPAFAFDFHSSVVAAMALPWYLLALRQGKLGRSWWLLLFMIIAKENIGFWMFVVALASLALPRGVGIRRWQVLTQAAVALCWSVLVISVVMPALNESGQFQHNHYSVLGRNGGEIMENVFTHPFQVFRAFFEDVQGKHPLGTSIKLEFYFLLLLSGGWALFKRWPYLLMCAPVIAQKMLHDNTGMWGCFAHYCVEFSMILPLAVFGVVITLRQRWMKLVMASTALLFTIGATLYALDFPLEHQSHDHGYHDSIRFYQERHYVRRFDTGKVDRVLEMIPKDAAVSALSPLVPHLIARRDLYMYPVVDNAQYIILLPGDNPYPMEYPEYEQRIDGLRKDPAWRIVHDDPQIIIFQKN
jgi:uncharacterized membrane protein